MSATDLTTIEVEGTLHEIDEARSVTLSPNAMHRIMITSEADGISTPGLKFRTSAMAENEFVVIFPDEEAHRQIAELEDDALWNATDAQGNLIVDRNAHTQSEIASVQKTIKRVMATTVPINDTPATDTDVFERNGLGRTVSKSRAVVSNQTSQLVSDEALGDPWTLHFAPRPSTIPAGSAGLVMASDSIWQEPVNQNDFAQRLAQVVDNRSADSVPATAGPIGPVGPVASLRIGGFFGGIKDAFKNAVSVTIGFANNVVNALVDIGGQIVRFVLDTAQKVAEFVEAVIEKVVEGIKQFIEFLRFLFAWDDILATQRFLVRTINSAFDSAEHLVASAKEPVSAFIDDLQEGIEDGVNSLIRRLGVDPAETESDSGFELPEAAEWFLDKLLGGSRKEGADLGPDATASASAENEGTPLQRAFTNLMQALQGVADVGARVFEGLFETIEALVANPRRPELALVEILATFRDVGMQLLDIGENVIHGFLDLVVAVIDLLQDALNTEIRIPFISDLFKLLGAGKLTILNLFSLLLAIPITVIAKLMTGRAPFQNAAPLEFPQQNAAPPEFSQQAVIAEQRSFVAQEPRDIAATQQKIFDFGVVALTADAFNGLFFTLLDAVPEDFDDDGKVTRFIEMGTLLISGFSWLASFPSSPIEPGGYPYNIAHPRHKVNKHDHKQEYWERVLWSWRTGVFGLDIVYMIVAPFIDEFPDQRLRRANKFTAGFLTVAGLVDIGLAGRFLHEVDEKQGREIANEVLGRLPDVTCLLRQIDAEKAPKLLAAGIIAHTAVNITATIATTVIGVKALKENLRFFEE